MPVLSLNYISTRGFSLVPTLLLLTVLSLLALAGHRAAIAEARISQSMAGYQQAFAIASLQLTTGLQLARDEPESLPTTTTPLVLEQISNPTAWANATLVHLTQDMHCPDLAPAHAERLHFEIRAHGYASRGAERELIQGFWICREVCSPPCTGIVTGPRISYWYAPQ